MSSNKIKPEWAPDNSVEEFASEVKKGVKSFKKAANHKTNSAKLDIPDFKRGILEGNLPILARAITLIESNSRVHIEKAQKLISEILPHTGNSVRVGISGPPGAGKSTFIDSLGDFLCGQGKKVAVLSVDPSSKLSGGSILGDKTRMERLSRRENSFIRPSPSGGALGGVARKTRETILLCEAAGFDTVIIETMGVGQSEITVRSMTDVFLLLLLPGSGDNLQGIKKGIVEIADLLAVNKADGDAKNRAELTKKAYEEALHYLISEERQIPPKVFTCSALEDDKIDVLWNEIAAVTKKAKESGAFNRQRNNQLIDWITSLAEEQLISGFYSHPAVAELLPKIKDKSLKGEITPVNAVLALMEAYNSK